MRSLGACCSKAIPGRASPKHGFGLPKLQPPRFAKVTGDKSKGQVGSSTPCQSPGCREPERPEARGNPDFHHVRGHFAASRPSTSGPARPGPEKRRCRAGIEIPPYESGTTMELITGATGKASRSTRLPSLITALIFR